MTITPTFEYTLATINALTSTVSQVFLQPKTTALFYQAGQYLELHYPNSEFQPFSIANAPQANGVIELHIRHLENDKATQQFLNTLQLTKTITLRGPFGRCIHQSLTKPTLFLAAGTGFAQAKAIIEQVALINHATLFHLYWGVKIPSDFYILDTLTQWQKKLKNFCYTLVISQPDNTTNWSGDVGYIHEKAISDHPDLSNYQVYASGPLPMVLASLKLTETHGLPRTFFYSDMLSP